MPQMEAIDLAGQVLRVEAGRRLVVVGIGRDGVAQAIASDTDRTRSVLLLASDGQRTGAAVLDRLLDDLADLALARWPYWHGQRETVPERLGRSLDPPISRPWLKAAAKRAAFGRPPRFRSAAREIELVQLLCAIDPAGVILVAEIDPVSPVRATPVVEAMEWCARHGAAIMVALPAMPPAIPPYERILYGANEIVREPVPVVERFIAPRTGAHHASAVEQRVAAALRQDAELGSLFACNAPVPIGGWGASARVDLFCAEHRVVVELDGPEHRAAPKFGSDRHRDYELLVAGYLVLRITNDQVEADLQHSIEKIRNVVRLRSQGCDV